MTNKEFRERLSAFPDDADVVSVNFDPIDGEIEAEVEPSYNEFSNKVFI